MYFSPMYIHKNSNKDMQVSSSLLTPVMPSSNLQYRILSTASQASLPRPMIVTVQPQFNKRRRHHLTCYLSSLYHAWLLRHHHSYHPGGDTHHAIWLGIRVRRWRAASPTLVRLVLLHLEKTNVVFLSRVILQLAVSPD